MDTSIIGVALPAIQEQFSFSQSDLQWIFSAYVIVFGHWDAMEQHILIEHKKRTLEELERKGIKVRI